MAEVVARRGRFERHFTTATPGRFTAEVHSAPIHFKHKDTLTWEPVADLIDGNGWTQGADVQFGIVNGYATAVRGARSLAFRPAAILLIDRATGQTQQIATANYANTVRNGDTWHTTNVFPGVDLYVRLREQSMSKRFVLASRPNLPDPTALGMDPATTYVSIAYDVDDQTGITPIMEENGQPFAQGSFTDGAIVYRDGQGNDVFRLAAGQGGSAAGHRRSVWYFRRPGIAFGEAFPYRFVDIATYPVWIDPTTSVYAGSEDGYIHNSVAYSSTATGFVGKIAGGKTYPESRCYVRFDLSSLSGNTCNSATLYIYINGLLNWSAGTIAAKLYDTDWGPTLAAGDWGQAGTNQGSSVSPTASAYNTWTCTAASIEADFGSASSFEIYQDTSLADNRYAQISLSETSGTSQDPYIYIDYTAGGGGPTRRVFVIT